MCGRYGLTAEAEDFLEEFDLFEEPPELEFQSHAPKADMEFQFGGATSAIRYDIHPMEMVPVLRLREGRPVILMQRWGFTPAWMRKKNQPGESPRKAASPPPIFNTRSEKLHDSTYWKKFLNNRCLIPASFFYEWQDTGASRPQPWMIKTKKQPLIAFAGIWSTENDPKTGHQIEVCSIITTQANPLLKKIHNRGKNPFRQPVILEGENRQEWLITDPPPSQERDDTLTAPLEESRFEVFPLIKTGNDREHTPPVIKPEN